MRLAQAWTALRRDQREQARRRFTEFATAYPSDPRGADALVLASELALRSQDVNAARRLLEQVIKEYPTSPRTRIRPLNLAILLARTGDTAAAQRALTEWLAQSPFPPLIGRARASLGAVHLAANRPAEAGREFTLARKEGGGAIAALGLGTVALRENRWDDAERELKEAAGTGTAAVTATAEYGLAVVALQKGNPGEFKKIANQTLDAAPTGPAAPHLLYILTGLAVQERDWAVALTTAKRLVAQFKGAEFADDALERVIVGSAQAQSWRTVSEAYQLLRQQYPQSPFVASSRSLFAEAEIENGRPDVARRELEAIAPSLTSADASRALVALGRAREATGDRAGALDAFSRASRGAGSAGLSKDALVQQARILLEEKRWNEARGCSSRCSRVPSRARVADAAQGIGQSFQGEGNYLAAAEYFMTAAYVAPESAAGRRACWGGRKLRRPQADPIGGRRLSQVVAQPDAPPDLAAAARKGLEGHRAQ